MPKCEVYVSVDVEADGPIPGPYSMLSFGLAECGTFDGHVFMPVDPGSDAHHVHRCRSPATSGSRF